MRARRSVRKFPLDFPMFPFLKTSCSQTPKNIDDCETPRENALAKSVFSQEVQEKVFAEAISENVFQKPLFKTGF